MFPCLPHQLPDMTSETQHMLACSEFFSIISVQIATVPIHFKLQRKQAIFVVYRAFSHDGHVGAPNQPIGNKTVFLCKLFFFVLIETHEY